MTEDEARMLANKIDYEGLEYALFDYSEWKDIKDKKFHKLRKQAEKSFEQLKDYLKEVGVLG